MGDGERRWTTLNSIAGARNRVHTCTRQTHSHKMFTHVCACVCVCLCTLTHTHSHTCGIHNLLKCVSACLCTNAHTHTNTRTSIHVEHKTRELEIIIVLCASVFVVCVRACVCDRTCVCACMRERVRAKARQYTKPYFAERRRQLYACVHVQICSTYIRSVPWLRNACVYLPPTRPTPRPHASVPYPTPHNGQSNMHADVFYCLVYRRTRA